MFRRFTLLAFAVLAVVAVTAGSASASVGLASCPAADTSRPFLPWLDLAPYVAVPGGDMEPDTAPWLLSGAAMVEGNEPYRVGGATDHRSLRIAPGGSATTAPMCLGVEHPSLRFFLRRSGGWLTDSLRVDAIVTYPGAVQYEVPVASTPSLGIWAPSIPLPLTIGALTSLAPGESPLVAFRFSGRGTAAWLVDDVYVDPFRTR